MGNETTNVGPGVAVSTIRMVDSMVGFVEVGDAQACRNIPSANIQDKVLFIISHPIFIRIEGKSVNSFSLPIQPSRFTR